MDASVSNGGNVFSIGVVPETVILHFILRVTSIFDIN
jgi:hypothetical protein